MKEVKSDSIVETCNKVSKISIYLLVFLLPILFLPWTANVLDFNKQALLIVLVFIAIFAWMLKVLITGQAGFSLSLVHIPVAVLLLIYIGSTIFSFSQYGSFWGWAQVSSESLLTLMGLTLLYLLIVNAFERKEIFYLIIALTSKNRTMTITVNVELMGALRKPTGKRKFAFTLEGNESEGFTIANLLTQLNFTVDEQKYLIISVNGERQPHHAYITNGDSVFVGMTVGGGN